MKAAAGKPRITADINITPFTDVVLVLLIVFMVATPALYDSGLKVELPHGTSAQDTKKDVVVTIDAEGNIYLAGERMDVERLKSAIKKKLRSEQAMSVIVDGDRNVRYDAVVRVMDALAQAGVTNPGLGIELQR